MNEALPETAIEQADTLEREGASVESIAWTLSREFGRTVGALELRAALKAHRQGHEGTDEDQGPDIADERSQLLWARKKLRARLEDDTLPNGAFVELAREFRQNIVSGQELATMNDASGQYRFVIVYGNNKPAPVEDSKTLDVPGRFNR